MSELRTSLFPPTSTDLATGAIEGLADAVATDGVGAHLDDVLTLARGARARGVPTVLVDVLTDAAAPDVVRVRAFGLVLRALARPRPDIAPAAFMPADPPCGRHAQLAVA